MADSPEETDNSSDSSDVPEQEDCSGKTTGDAQQGAGTYSPRPTFARLREEQQRVAGGGRWSVDASRRQCFRCQQEIPRGTSFWTVLAEADPDQAGEVVAAYFSRQDHCEGCIEDLEEDPFFARWKTSVPAPDGPPRRIVNIVSLHATFLSLMETSVTSSESADCAEDTQEDLHQPDQPSDQDLESTPKPQPQGLEVSEEADRIRLAYLLALFLVRKRVLRWVGHEQQVLSVQERAGTLHRVPVPSIDAATLEDAVAELEEFLG